MDAQPITRLDHSQTSGKPMGAGIQERESHLTVDFERSTVELRQHSPSDDTVSDPIGLFKMPLSSERRASLTALLDRADLKRIPAGGRRGPRDALLLVRLWRGRVFDEARFGVRNAKAQADLGPLLEELGSLADDVWEHPTQAVGLTLDANPTRDRTFRFQLRNVGTMPLAILPPGAAVPRLTGVRVAPLPPERPGVTEPPLEWSLLGLSEESKKTASTAPVILKPGEGFDLESERWHLPAATEFLVQASYAVYDGPAAYEGLPVIKGRLFSESAEIRPPAK